MEPEFDNEYFNKIFAFIQQRENYYYSIAALTDDPEKLIYHLKYYIDNRGREDLEIEFREPTETEVMYRYGKGNYTEFRTCELFESITKWNELDPDFRKQRKVIVKPKEPVPVEVTQERKDPFKNIIKETPKPKPIIQPQPTLF